MLGSLSTSKVTCSCKVPSLPLIAGLEAAIDDPLIADAFAHLDRTRAHAVTGTNHLELIRPLDLDDRALGHQQRAFDDARLGADFRVLPWAQRVACVGKHGAEAD